MGEVAKLNNGKDYKHLGDGNIPVYGTGGYMLSVNQALSYKDDAIGIGRKGTIDKPYILKAPFWTVDTLFYSIPNDKTELNFLFATFQKVDWKAADESTGVPSLSKSTIENIITFFPSLPEQARIGAFFCHLDRLITLHQCNCNMATRPCEWSSGLRAIAWEQRKLGELGSVAMCKRIFKDQTSEEGDVPFYKIGTFGEEPDAYISRELFDEYKSKYPYPDKGTILISASGSIGRVVEFAGKDEYFQDSNIVWLKHDKRIADTFLKYIYEVISWAGIEGSTIKRLYNDNILKTEVKLPCIDEQEHIGRFFRHLDHLVTLHQRKHILLT